MWLLPILVALIVNTAWLLLSQQAFVLNRVIPTCTSEKSECSKSFERFTLSLTEVVNYGERFDDCRCAGKWEWVSLNSSQTDQV